MKVQDFDDIIALAIKFLEEDDINSAIVTLTCVQLIRGQPVTATPVPDSPC
ncbi:hypothetical protein [Acinetobacter johnsonii]|uniref:hypothetical protein n=1 Tax=Acinetobacter johnsonii TaxID=40214 RepID=UPI0019184539|nr:hypothetical protein [Acinetobacter johnsonii]QQT94632.1 hypothetical protein I6I51_08090 [Acinetobacter johnsonii]